MRRTVLSSCLINKLISWCACSHESTIWRTLEISFQQVFNMKSKLIYCERMLLCVLGKDVLFCHQWARMNGRKKVWVIYKNLIRARSHDESSSCSALFFVLPSQFTLHVSLIMFLTTQNAAHIMTSSLLNAEELKFKYLLWLFLSHIIGV